MNERVECMRNKFSGLAPAIVAVVATTVGAHAADLGPNRGRQTWNAPQSSYYPEAFRWSGFYAGVQAGYGWGSTTATSTTIAPYSWQSFDYGTSGGVGGVHAGFNWQSQRFVMGVETDLELSGISGSGLGTLGGGHITNVDWLGSLRGRLGYSMGQTLFYLTGGLAYGGVSVDRSAGAGFTPFIGESAWKTGWTLGGGIEHAFTHNISARIEYRYTDLGQISYTNFPSNLSDTSDVTHSAVRAGLSFKF